MRRQLVVVALIASACASAPRSTDRFTGEVPLQITIRGSLYTGSARLTQRAGGSSTGTFTVAGPVEVKGTVSGRIEQSALALDLMYEIAQNGCKGTMRLRGPISAGTAVEGEAEAEDSCVGRMSGTFKLGSP